MTYTQQFALSNTFLLNPLGTVQRLMWPLGAFELPMSSESICRPFFQVCM